MKYLMGVDEGTGGCRAILFDQEGRQIAVTGREYPSYYPHPGWSEQNIDEIRGGFTPAYVKRSLSPRLTLLI